MNALRAAADFTGAPAFAPSLPTIPLFFPLPPPGASAKRAPVQVLPDRGLRERTLGVGLVIAKRQGSLVCNSGCVGGAGGYAPSAGAHGFGDDFELVGTRFVVLLLVLDATVVLEEELARLLQHPATLADGTVGHKQGENTIIYFLFEVMHYIS